MKLRVLLRECDVYDVITTLREIIPAVREGGPYLAAHEVKKGTNKRVAKWSIDNAFLSSRVRFRLPDDESSTVLRILKNKSVDGDTEIEIGSDGERTYDMNGFVVTIEKRGQFTHEQLEVIEWLWKLQSACREAVLCCTWLIKMVEHDTGQPLAVLLQLLDCWSYAALKGFRFDLTYIDLFCLRDTEWLNDNAMRAVAVRLARFKDNRSVRLPPSTYDEKRELTVCEEMIGLVAQVVASRPFILMPVNLGGVHWVRIVIDRSEKKVKVYDSLNGTRSESY